MECTLPMVIACFFLYNFDAVNVSEWAFLKGRYLRALTLPKHAKEIVFISMFRFSGGGGKCYG